ncbi:B-cell antigen receptor complex-associated protein beta chain [Dendropsophus ebraccatus]|uniref:B-cell antigen receptor complex-associated protein beta chain n=1 Tax=Dendropsophus ebraccatus TaxID=150705 RepID=UPI00383141FE
MTTREAVLCAFCIAALLLDQGCCAQNKTFEQSDQGCRPRNYTCEGSDDLRQHYRFMGVKKGKTARIPCGHRYLIPRNSTISWYRGHQNGSVITYLDQEPHMKKEENSLIINNVQSKDNGVYFCICNTTKEMVRSICGTELMVLGCHTTKTAQTRNTMKDTIIVIQTMLIALFLVVPVTLLRDMNKKRSLKIEDHTYEGLEAYQTATYEDIQTVRVLAAKSMEGEHPCLE